MKLLLVLCLTSALLVQSIANADPDPQNPTDEKPQADETLDVKGVSKSDAEDLNQALVKLHDDVEDLCEEWAAENSGIFTQSGKDSHAFVIDVVDHIGHSINDAVREGEKVVPHVRKELSRLFTDHQMGDSVQQFLLDFDKKVGAEFTDAAGKIDSLETEAKAKFFIEIDEDEENEDEDEEYSPSDEEDEEADFLEVEEADEDEDEDEEYSPVDEEAKLITQYSEHAQKYVDTYVKKNKAEFENNKIDHEGVRKSLIDTLGHYTNEGIREGKEGRNLSKYVLSKIKALFDEHNISLMYKSFARGYGKSVHKYFKAMSDKLSELVTDAKNKAAGIKAQKPKLNKLSKKTKAAKKVAKKVTKKKAAAKKGKKAAQKAKKAKKQAKKGKKQAKKAGLF